MQDFGEDCSSESESDEDAESAEEYASESEVDDATEAANEEEWASSGEARSEASDDERDVQASAEALKKLVPYNLEDFEKVILLNNFKNFDHSGLLKGWKVHFSQEEEAVPMIKFGTELCRY